MSHGQTVVLQAFSGLHLQAEVRSSGEAPPTRPIPLHGLGPRSAGASWSSGEAPPTRPIPLHGL
eukprot:8987187-Lingulodinium_polyedra.AAC.1